MKTINSFVGVLTVWCLLTISGCGSSSDNTTVNPENPAASPKNASKVEFNAPKVEAKEDDGKE